MISEALVTDLDINHLELTRHPVDEDNIEVFDIRDDESANDRQVYSCVAMYRKNWRNDWPALGGLGGCRRLGMRSLRLRWRGRKRLRWRWRCS